MVKILLYAPIRIRGVNTPGGPSLFRPCGTRRMKMLEALAVSANESMGDE